MPRTTYHTPHQLIGFVCSFDGVPAVLGKVASLDKQLQLRALIEYIDRSIPRGSRRGPTAKQVCPDKTSTLFLRCSFSIKLREENAILRQQAVDRDEQITDLTQERDAHALICPLTPRAQPPSDEASGSGLEQHDTEIMQEVQVQSGMDESM